MRGKVYALMATGLAGLLYLTGCGSARTADSGSGKSSGGSHTGLQISGRIAWVPQCGTPAALPIFTVTLNSTPQQQTQTDANGNFTFSGVANGAYTLTPSYAGPSGSNSVFLPKTMNLSVNNTDANNENFQVALGYTVSGAVSYAGTHTGRIYVDLVQSNCGRFGSYGTSIAGSGTYNIRGVQPGTYTVHAWMDPLDLGLGQGMLNAYDPTADGTLTVGTSNTPVANLKLANHDPDSAPSGAPRINGIAPMHNGVAVEYSAAQDQEGAEAATSYDVAWSGSPGLAGGSLSSVSGTFNYKAVGAGNPLLMLNDGVRGISGSPFSDGRAYYFEMRSNNSAGHGPWIVYGGSTPIPVTVGPASPSGGFLIATTINIPKGVAIAPGAPLYVGYLGQDSFYAAEIANPQLGNNTVSIRAPQGAWLLLGMLDQNNDGEIDAGDITNSRQNGPPSVSLDGGTTALSESLSAESAIPVVQTVYYQNSDQGGSSSGYSLPIGAGEGAKLPVALTLTGASDPDVLVPMDLSNDCQGCRNVEFENEIDLGSLSPKVGDTYTMQATYSDGSQETVVAKVTGWNGGPTVVSADDLPTQLSPSGTGSTSTKPTFTWANPGGLQAGDNYSFSICCNNNQVIWQIPGQGSRLNEFSPSISSISWGTDPTGDTNNLPNPASLSTGTVYRWSLQLSDPYGNMAQAQTWYQP